MIDTQTSFTELLRKRKRTARTYVGEKGRDDPVTTILKSVGIDSKAKLQAARKQAANILDLPDAGTAWELVTCKNVADQLEKEFTGWTWGVGVNQGVLVIRCREISLTWGPNWPLQRGTPHPTWVRAEAGAYLERYRAPRQLRSADQFNIFLSEDAKFKFGRGGYQMAFEA